MEVDDLLKRAEIANLFMQADLGRFANYFDLSSTENLDEKIRVLGEVVEGRPISEIEGFMDIFELLPEDGLWD